MLVQLKLRKKEIIVISFILLFALISTYSIYYKFKDSRNVDYNTPTIDVTYHEKSGDKVNITRVTPVTDSVGLSSTAYNFTVKNNTNKSISYSIRILDNDSYTEKDGCHEYQIPHNIIKFSIHKENEKVNIYSLSDLVNGEVLTRIIKPHEQEEYTMRFWINKSSISSGALLHYHGIIKVEDEGTKVAANIN